MKNMIVICPTLSQPRFHKRVQQLAEIFHLDIFAFSRGLYEVNTFPEEFTPIPLGKIQDKNYFKRVLKLIQAVIKIRKCIVKIDMSDSFFYAFSLDTLIISRLCGLKNGFYEVGDIRFDRSKRTIFSVLENILVKYIKAVVVTSPGFVDEIKKTGPKFKKIPYLVIENKVPPSLCRPLLGLRPIDCERKIRIGVIGFLRYEAPLKRIVSFVLKYSDLYELHCWGDGPFRMLFENHISPSIKFYGSFKNPESLESIYSNIDLNYVVYGGDMSSEIGVQLAIPNKLYESIFYGVPLLCRSNTEVGVAALRMGVGLVVNDREFEKTVIAVDYCHIKEMQKKCEEIPLNDLIDTGEVILKNAIRLLNKPCANDT
jgi:succinoglycan biosynthesis protein ExoL